MAQWARGAVLLLTAGLLVGCGSLPLLPRKAPPAIVVDEVPQPLSAGFEQAMTAAQQGDETAAISELERLAQAYPQYGGPLLNLGLLHLRAGRLEPARDAFLGAVARNARSAPAFTHLGIVYRRLGEFEQAERAYQQAVQADPSYPLSYLNLGVLHDLYLQQPQQALQAYRQYQALALQPRPEVAEWINELQRRVAAGGTP